MKFATLLPLLLALLALAIVEAVLHAFTPSRRRRNGTNPRGNQEPRP